ncbi:Mbeg1-like protein, partial [uncultured Fretibacterium sp.]|uniref:Mbeg1-like protein n=1 Tax=uncultured Fretibacterium sp. TaxID=1678694 RepID=UPI00262E7EF7
FTNDGPGFANAVTRLPAYRDLAPRIVSIIPENSLVGILMDSAVDHRIVRSSNRGPTAHDALSWLVRGNHFLPAEGRSGFSVFFERSVRAWLADLSDEEKRRFVESVFGVLESTGALTLEEMRRTPVRSAFAILKASRALSPDRQKQVRAVLARLAEKGGSVFAQTFGGSAAELRRRLSAWLRGDPQG